MSMDAIFAYFFLNHYLTRNNNKPSRNQFIMACKQGLTHSLTCSENCRAEFQQISHTILSITKAKLIKIPSFFAN